MKTVIFIALKVVELFAGIVIPYAVGLLWELVFEIKDVPNVLALGFVGAVILFFAVVVVASLWELVKLNNRWAGSIEWDIKRRKK